MHKLASKYQTEVEEEEEKEEEGDRLLKLSMSQQALRNATLSPWSKHKMKEPKYDE